MRNLLFFLTLIFGFQALAQEDTTFYNRDWYETDRELASYYRNLEKINDSLWYFQDKYIQTDKLQNDGFYSSLQPHVRDSLYTWYYENGVVSLRGSYQDGNRVGVWKEYFQTGDVKMSGKYRDGEREGKWKWRYEGGSTKSIAHYKKGLLDGERNWWYESGKSKIEEYYREGKLDSTFHQWYENGQFKLQAQYDQGQLKDTLFEWYPNGVLKRKEFYESGISIDSLAIWQDTLGNVVDQEDIINNKSDHQLLWKVSGNGLEKPSYIFGTMHVRDPRAFEFSDSMVTIFEQCEAMSMEIHPDSMYAFNFQATQDEIIARKPGLETPQYYTYDGYDDYDNYDSWYWYNTGWVVDLNTLFNRAYGPQNAKPYFLDVYLFYLAEKANKKTFGLERIEDHIKAGDDLPTYQKSYDILSHFNPDEEMLEVYQEGNIEKIRALMTFLTNKEFSYRLLTLRNHKMADQIDSLAHLYSTFNTCGCAHLYGDDGVIELLRKKGYDVTPVDVVFNEKEIPISSDYKFEWSSLKRGGVSVLMPGRPVLNYDAGYERYIAMDLIQKNGFSVAVVDLNFDTLNVDLKNYETLIETKLNLDWDLVQNLNKSKSKNRRTLIFDYPLGTIFSRYKIILDKGTNKMIALEAAAFEKEELLKYASSKFFSSVKFINQEVEPDEWNITTDTVGAFRVQFPQSANYDHDWNRQYYEIPNSTSGNRYFIRYFDLNSNHIWRSDSSYFEAVKRSFATKYGELLDEKVISKSGYRGVAFSFDYGKGFELKINAYRRGNRDYLLMVHQQPGGEEDTKKFFDSFGFIPLKNSGWISHEVDSVSISFPNDPDENFTYGSNAYYRNDYYSVYNDGVEVAVEEDANSYSYYDSYGNKGLLSDTEYEYRYDNKHYLISKDSLSGVYYIFEEAIFSDYAFVENLDTLFEMYSRVELDSTASKTYYADSTLKLDAKLNYKNRNVIKKYQLHYFGGHVFELKAYYPKELEGDPHIDYFFNSFDLSRLPDTIDITTPKIERIFDGLSSPDTLTQYKTTGALAYYDFDSTHLPRIYREAFREAAADTLEILNNAYDLLDLAVYHRDSTTLPFIKAFYEQYCDTMYKQQFVLERLARIGSERSLSLMLELLPDTLNKGGYYYSSKAEKLTEPFHDSLELAAKMYPQLFQKLDHYNLEFPVLKLTRKLLTADTLFPEVVVYKDSLTKDFISIASSLIQMDPDSSDFRKTKRKATRYLEFVGELNEEDEVTALLDSLVHFDDDEIPTLATIALVQFASSSDEAIWSKLFQKSDDPYALILTFRKKEKLNLIPSKYLIQEEIAKQSLIHSIMEEGYSYRKPTIEKLKLIKSIAIEHDGEKQRYYLFQYYKGTYGRERYMALSSPQPMDKSEINWTEYSWRYEIEYKFDDEPKKLEKDLIEMVREDLTNDYEESEAFAEEIIEMAE